MASAELVILCLPDDAARESVQLIGNNDTKVLDASTAHRIHEDWSYGLPELRPGQREQIRNARRVSNPGCYPTGFLTLIAPLIDAGALPPDALITINAVSGYSGGGRQMIERYEARSRTHPDALWYSRPYALRQEHKHVPEMKHFAGLANSPTFIPSVGHFRQGMLVNVPLLRGHFARRTKLEDVRKILAERYDQEDCIHVHDVNDESLLEDGFLDPQLNNGTNRLDVFVFGNDDHILLIALLDNLGKGASGAAVQNLNLMLGNDEMLGLEF